jgi:hypothetical protein
MGIYERVAKRGSMQEMAINTTRRSDGSVMHVSGWPTAVGKR